MKDLVKRKWLGQLGSLVQALELNSGWDNADDDANYAAPPFE